MKIEPDVIRTHKYFCSACSKHCCIVTIHEGLVPDTCEDAENEHKLTNWQKTEQIFEFTVFETKVEI